MAQHQQKKILFTFEKLWTLTMYNKETAQHFCDIENVRIFGFFFTSPPNLSISFSGAIETRLKETHGLD